MISADNVSFSQMQQKMQTSGYSSGKGVSLKAERSPQQHFGWNGEW